jgi:hypothetical protein
MKVIKTDRNGEPVLDHEGKPAMIEIPDAMAEGTAQFLTTDEADKKAKEAANKAAFDAKKKMEKELADSNAARDSLQARMDAADKAAKEAARSQLPPDQQVLSRMTELEHDLAQTRAQVVQVQADATHQVRQVGLVAYRERAIRDVPEEVAHLVYGQSEAEIDQAVDDATKTYRDLEAKFAQKYEQYVPPTPPAYQPPQHFAQPQGYVPAQPPQNPHYVPPVPPQYAAQGGFPTPTNPLPIPDPSVAGEQANVTEMTSEQAVRSGRYGGEMRDRIHAQLKGNARYPGSLGSAPRHWSAGQQPGHLAMPGGVMQPQGTPMGPVQPAAMPYQQPPPPPSNPYAQPQMQQQYAPAPVDGHRAAAQEAISRMHSGGNAIANGDSAANNALQAAHQHANARGIASPAQAFGARFAPTPPVTS